MDVSWPVLSPSLGRAVVLMEVSGYGPAGRQGENDFCCSWSEVLIWGPKEATANPLTLLQFKRKT